MKKEKTKEKSAPLPYGKQFSKLKSISKTWKKSLMYQKGPRKFLWDFVVPDLSFYISFSLSISLSCLKIKLNKT